MVLFSRVNITRVNMFSDSEMSELDPISEILKFPYFPGGQNYSKYVPNRYLENCCSEVNLSEQLYRKGSFWTFVETMRKGALKDFGMETVKQLK